MSPSALTLPSHLNYTPHWVYKELNAEGKKRKFPVNGVHDMGGMDGFGPIPIEENEPVFHAEWEGRTFAICLSFLSRLQGFRHAIERIAAPVYLASSYYDRWLIAIATFLMEKGQLTREELTLRGIDSVALVQPAADYEGSLQAPALKEARFREGDHVVARNINPIGHTRLPRYVRGKRGVIHRDWGVYAFPDSSVHNAGEHAQHVYSVAFDMRELWGDNVPRSDTLRIDLWEDYLDADRTSTKRTKNQAQPQKKQR